MARDGRGQIRFVNDFDMKNVKRFYIIANANTGLVRGWRGHRAEKRWFYTLSGRFAIDLVKIDDWERASNDLPVEKCILAESDQQVLCVPEGYATAFQALEEHSELLVFADSGIETINDDDFTWPQSYFINRQNI